MTWSVIHRASRSKIRLSGFYIRLVLSMACVGMAFVNVLALSLIWNRDALVQLKFASVTVIFVVSFMIIRSVIERVHRIGFELSWSTCIWGTFWQAYEINWCEVQEIRERQIILKSGAIIHLNRIAYLELDELEIIKILKRKFSESLRLGALNIPVKPPRLGDESQILRPWQATDRADFMALYQESTILAGHHLGRPIKKTLVRRFESVVGANPKTHSSSWHWVLGINDETGHWITIGHVDAWLTALDPNEASIAYSLLPAYRKAGRMALSLRWVLETLMFEWQLVVVHAECWSNNESSIKLLEALAFEPLPEQTTGRVNYRLRRPLGTRA